MKKLSVPPLVKKQAAAGSQSARFIVAHLRRYPTLEARQAAVDAWIRRQK